jgi:hypothetical protein
MWRSDDELMVREPGGSGICCWGWGRIGAFALLLQWSTFVDPSMKAFYAL